jgi:hypothetical protein
MTSVSVTPKTCYTTRAREIKVPLPICGRLVDSFLASHSEQITIATIHAQEDLRFQVPHQLLGNCPEVIRSHVLDPNSSIAFNVDETGCSDLGERKTYDRILPVELTHRITH